MTRDLQPGVDFHDSSLVAIDVSPRLDRIMVVVYAPNAGPEWAKGRFYELTFDAVLRFKFETLGIGEPQGKAQEIYDISLLEGEEQARWLERMALLAQPDTFGYRKPSRSYRAPAVRRRPEEKAATSLWRPQLRHGP